MNMQYAHAVIAHERAYRERVAHAVRTPEKSAHAASLSYTARPSIDSQMRMSG